MSEETERKAIVGPVVVRNIFEGRRVWPDLTTVSGHTLDLEAGAEDLLPADPGDVAYLQIRKPDAKATKSDSENPGG